MINLRQIHFGIGLLTVVHFVITGALMRFNFFDIGRDDMLVRMMFRANHIYILFAGLLNLLLYFIIPRSGRRNLLLLVASILVIAGTIGLHVAFYRDPISHSLQRDISRFSLIACFAGTALYLFYFKFLMKGNRNR